MIFSAAFASIKRGTFIRSVGVLVGGTVFAHAITALTLPVLTRLYSPADFSVLAVFSGLLALVAVAACLRFDIAIPIPASDADGMNLLGLALTCAALVSVLLAVPVLLVPEKITHWLNQPAMTPYLWLLPAGVLLSASYSALQCWFVRRQEFGAIARTRIGQSVASASAQTGLGFAGVTPFGLLVGQILNTGGACILLGYRMVQRERSALSAISWQHMRTMFAAHHRFPKYSTLEALSNSAAIQVPIIMIAALAMGPEAGYLTLAMYVMQAPMALIGGAVGHVYVSRAPDEYRAGRLGTFTAVIFGGLLKAGVGPLLFAGIVAPVVFATIFGEHWRRAGVLVSWMTPWFVMQYVAAPISMALHVTAHQRAALVLQLFGLVLRVATVYAMSVFAGRYISEAYAISGFAFYLTYYAVLTRAVGLRGTDLAHELRSALPIILLWAIAAVVVGSVMTHLIPRWR